MMPAREFVRDAREKKREAALAIGVDEDFIASFVDRFYAEVREDDLLAPIFAKRVEDWPAHLAQMNRFWRSILHNSGEFSGSPMAKHIAIAELEQVHFERWLTLFYRTLSAIQTDPAATSQVGDKARTIAESLLAGIDLHRADKGVIPKKKELPHV